ncbi:MAG TPA: helicase HerA-like domain-containing protein, partial [Nitrospirota bacterium]
EKAVDRESAYEKLKQRAEETQAQEPETAARRGRATEPQSDTAKIFGAMAKSAAHAIGSQIGRQIIRGVLGSILGGSGKRRT